MKVKKNKQRRMNYRCIADTTSSDETEMRKKIKIGEALGHVNHYKRYLRKTIDGYRPLSISIGHIQMKI